MDKKLLPVLAETMEPFDNVEIIPGDALKLDIQALALTRRTHRRTAESTLGTGKNFSAVTSKRTSVSM